MPKKVKVFEGQTFRVHSLGNGWAYEIETVSGANSWFYQDEEARVFWSECFEDCEPEALTDSLIGQFIALRS